MKMLMMFLFAFSSLFAQIKFDDHFVDKTLRLDYYHSGNKTEQWFTFAKLLEEPIWGGSKTNLVDTLNLGNFLVKVMKWKQTN